MTAINTKAKMETELTERDAARQSDEAGRQARSRKRRGEGKGRYSARGQGGLDFGLRF